MSTNHILHKHLHFSYRNTAWIHE